MPRYNVYRETNCRERYSVEADTPEAAIASVEDGNEQLMDDDVTSAGGYTVFDRDTGQEVTPVEEEPEFHEFECKVGVEARVYFDITIEATDPDSALDKLKEMVKSEPIETLDFDAQETEVTGVNPTVIYIRDEDENDHHDLVDLEPKPDPVEAADRAYRYTAETCPSKHWNGGDDICSDCGEDLNPPAMSEPFADDEPNYAHLTDFISAIARLSTPQEEWAPPKTCTYQGPIDPAVDECPSDQTYAHGLTYERLAGEYAAFMGVIRKARHLIVDPKTTALDA